MTEKSKLLAVIRVRGRVKVRHDVSETLDRLRLKRVNNLTLISTGSKSFMGMVQKAKDFITFGEIEKPALSKLLAAKGVKADESAVDSLLSGEKTPKDLNIELPFGMHPPKHGYEGVKIDYASGGSLGNRKAEINKLVLRML
jgi:large subunit ribosomal protein L30